MSRVSRVMEKCQMPEYQAIRLTEVASQAIADEIMAQAEIIEIEGDIYGMVPGLRRAAQIALNITNNGG